MEIQIKQLEAKIKDCLRLCEKYSSPKFTMFLTEEEQQELKTFPMYDYNILYFGGYNEARRKIFGVFPAWQEPDFDEFPIDIINISKKYQKELTHRDYLGTILSLGIERNTVGDILVYDSGAYVFLSRNISGLVLSGIDKISNCGVKTKLVQLKDIKVPIQEYDDILCIAASMRLDAIVGAAIKVSRNRAQGLIKNAKVEVNHKEIDDVSKTVNVGDIISVRGYGRYIVFEEGARTGSGKLHVHIKKFR